MSTHGTLADDPDYLAPDGSEVRLAGAIGGAGSLCEITLPAGETASAVTHRTVEELWLFTEGEGQVWRAAGEGDAGTVVDVRAGSWVTIPLGVRFQFRNTGAGPLRFVVATVPPWEVHDEAAADEAVAVPGRWPT